MESALQQPWIRFHFLLWEDMQIAKTALKEVPDVRQDRVSALKASIANGTYQVSAEDFADKLLAAYDEKSI